MCPRNPYTKGLLLSLALVREGSNLEASIVRCLRQLGLQLPWGLWAWSLQSLCFSAMKEASCSTMHSPHSWSSDSLKAQKQLGWTRRHKIASQKKAFLFQVDYLRCCWQWQKCDQHHWHLVTMASWGSRIQAATISLLTHFEVKRICIHSG